MKPQPWSLVIGTLALVALPAVGWAQAAKPPVPKHELAGREKCLSCHATGTEGAKAIPASHKDRGEESCAWCHAKDAAMQTKTPPAIPHALQGRSACLMCHKPNVMPAVPDVPADHQGRTDKNCQLCHHPKAG